MEFYFLLTDTDISFPIMVEHNWTANIQISNFRFIHLS